ncbi:hypothetical protein EB796_018548 [Bugula neritina]|uniref:Uncharacterized protein n=1 Tax=Bugula neritina TaxID=10212 RepID=A0A7J7JBX1_BUGNE|nr:hypothetical protein EB796_018548 [Bugula neritina]
MKTLHFLETASPTELSSSLTDLFKLVAVPSAPEPSSRVHNSCFCDGDLLFDYNVLADKYGDTLSQQVQDGGLNKITHSVRQYSVGQLPIVPVSSDRTEFKENSLRENVLFIAQDLNSNLEAISSIFEQLKPGDSLLIHNINCLTRLGVSIVFLFWHCFSEVAIAGHNESSYLPSILFQSCSLTNPEIRECLLQFQYHVTDQLTNQMAALSFIPTPVIMECTTLHNSFLYHKCEKIPDDPDDCDETNIYCYFEEGSLSYNPCWYLCPATTEEIHRIEKCTASCSRFFMDKCTKLMASTSEVSDSTTESPGGGLKTPEIVIIVLIAVLVVIIIIVLAAWCACRQRCRRRNADEPAERNPVQGGNFNGDPCIWNCCTSGDPRIEYNASSGPDTSRELASFLSENGGAPAGAANGGNNAGARNSQGRVDDADREADDAAGHRMSPAPTTALVVDVTPEQPLSHPVPDSEGHLPQTSSS